MEVIQDMTITKKILFLTLPLFLIFGIVLLYIGISNIEKEGQQSIEMIDKTMMKDRKEKLVDLVRNTYQIIVSQHEIANDPKKIAEAYKKQLASVVDLAFSQVTAIYNDVLLSDNQKKIQAMQLIKAMRYDHDNYLWINDMEPKMVMHPMKPALDGKSLTEFKDPHGKFLFNEMVKVCKENDSGFVDYMWPKPGEDKPVPKLSYVKLFKPWNWVIGTGVYLETAEKYFKEETKKQINALRFGPDNLDYFFIIATDNTMVMHPIN
jgi:methyl-accepting chemotaxis protein